VCAAASAAMIDRRPQSAIEGNPVVMVEKPAKRLPQLLPKPRSEIDQCNGVPCFHVFFSFNGTSEQSSIRPPDGFSAKIVSAEASGEINSTFPCL